MRTAKSDKFLDFNVSASFHNSSSNETTLWKGYNVNGFVEVVRVIPNPSTSILYLVRHFFKQAAQSTLPNFDALSIHSLVFILEERIYHLNYIRYSCALKQSYWLNIMREKIRVCLSKMNLYTYIIVNSMEVNNWCQLFIISLLLLINKVTTADNNWLW